MRIFEKDLFNFIFHPKKIGLNKIFFIKKHVNQYREELLILIETLEIMELTFGSSILGEIKKKISKCEEAMKK